MFSLLKAALTVAVTVAVPAVAQAQTWRDWGEAEVRELVSVENGTVNEVTVGETGGLEIYATLDGWLNMVFIGTDCAGQGPTQRCKELGFNALFEVNDTARSLVLERELIFRFVADMADGEDYLIHRQVDLGGGAPLSNIRAQLDQFIGTGEQVSESIWPATGGKATTKLR